MIKPLFSFRFWVTLIFSTSLSAEDSNPWFVNQNLIYERGDALSQQYLRDEAPEFSNIKKKTLPWIVRIEAQYAFKKNTFQSNHGTGIILKGGRVITAKHIFTKNVPADNKKLLILLTKTNGQVLQATLEKKGLRDWALLKITPPKTAKAKNQQQLLESPIKIRNPKEGETAIFWGYPARLGLDQKGKVQSFHKGNFLKKITTSQLTPMTVVSTVSEPLAMYLAPRAGFPPVGGMSGGPILNLKGELIGVQHSVTKTTDNATGKIIAYRIDAVPVNDIDLN